MSLLGNKRALDFKGTMEVNPESANYYIIGADRTDGYIAATIRSAVDSVKDSASTELSTNRTQS